MEFKDTLQNRKDNPSTPIQIQRSHDSFKMIG